MATTGTTDFFPATSDLVMSAFARLQMRRTEVTQQHLLDAQQEANFLQVTFCNLQPNLFTSQLLSVPLVSGTATYALPTYLISFMAVYLSNNDTGIDRILGPVSTYEYAALPNKTTSGQPNQYWFNRQVTPEITLWPVPDADNLTLKLRYLKQIEDAGMPNGTAPQIPYRWIDAFVAGLAARLAQIYKPELVPALDLKAKETWTIAATEDTEMTPLYITPGLSGYFN